VEFNELRDYVIVGNAKGAEEWTRRALSEGTDPLLIVDKGLVPGMDVVGEKFKNEEYYMPDMLVSARAMKTSMAILRPLLAGREGASLGRVVIGTVKGDLHDIGKNLVGMMLEGAGFDVTDLGTDVAPEAFVKAVRERGAHILGLSSLLTTTMPMMETTIEKLVEAGIRHTVKVMVGGAPITEAYSTRIGADGYAPEAATAVDTAKGLLGVAAR
jgi:5-methyltetrahydrofolate--homocysteine methyltransferase